MAEITKTEAKCYTPSKKDYYIAMIRNGWKLPSEKSAVITLEYMNAVRNKAVWCPTFEECRLAPCPVPP